MLRNYLNTGLNALNRNRVFAAINIFGLAIGMAACILLLLFVRYEMSYDKWLPGHENAYQVQTFFNDRDTGRAEGHADVGLCRRPHASPRISPRSRSSPMSRRAGR